MNLNPFDKRFEMILLQKLSFYVVIRSWNDVKGSNRSNIELKRCQRTVIWFQI